MSRPRLIALLLAVFTILVFLPTARFGFVNFDDNEYITDNPVVKNGLTSAGIKWAFTTYSVSNWHPLTWLSHMLDCELFGLNAGAHHLVNVLLHAANAALLFLLLLKLTNKLWPAALVAALFAWHPLHVESVAWISERKDVLSTLFALLAIWNYANFVKHNGRRSYWIALGCFALGLMAKPMLVTLPCVLLLLDFWPLGRLQAGKWNPKNGGPLLVEKIPFFLLSAVSCVLTLHAQHTGKALISLTQLPFITRCEVALLALAGYVGKLLWPVNLCALYLLPKQISPLYALACLVGLLAICFLVWRGRTTRPYGLTGWFWFVGMLIPVIGLVQVGDQAMADRYTYLPSVGFFLALVFMAASVAERLRVPANLRFAAAGLTCAACIFTTELQLPMWRDGEALFRQAVAVNPANDTALINLGVTLSAQGRFEEAVEVYRQAIKAGSQRVQLRNNLGNALGLLGRHEESLAEYREALRLAPQNPVVHFGTGKQLAALNQFNEALKAFAQAAQLAPNYAAPHLEAGKILFKLGQDDAGRRAFENAAQLAPNDFQTLATVAHYLAASENAAVRDGKTALALALRANALTAGSQPVLLDYLGMAYAEAGDFTNALLATQQACSLATAAGLNPSSMQERIKLYQERRPWRESFQTATPPVSR